MTTENYLDFLQYGIVAVIFSSFTAALFYTTEINSTPDDEFSARLPT